MAKIYSPLDTATRLIPASDPHPSDTFYKISIGTEVWDDGTYSVAKVQMQYGGKVRGRSSPSYPLGTDDFERVSAELVEMISKNK
jgi:hypothetical protein